MAVFFAVTLSMDALGVGFAYGLRGARPKLITYAIVFGVSLAVMACSVFFGNIFAELLTPRRAEIIAGTWIFLLGLWIVFSAIKSKPQGDKAAKTGIFGAFSLALMLSIDSAGAGLAAAAMGISIAFLPMYVAAFQAAFLALGVFVAKKMPVKKGASLPTLASGAILMTIGVIQLVL